MNGIPHLEIAQFRSAKHMLPVVIWAPYYSVVDLVAHILEQAENEEKAITRQIKRVRHINARMRTKA